MKPEDAENRAGTPIKQLSFFTAAKIAKWMAKSYGYRATKKHEYTSQDQACASQIHRSLTQFYSNVKWQLCRYWYRTNGRRPLMS